MDGLVALLLVALGMLFCAALPYVLVESRWRWRWREVEAGRVQADGAGAGGIYRAGGDVPRYLSEAPRVVRWAAFTSLLFGQMFIPGLLLGLSGLVMGGLGLVSIPGLITAAKLYRAGLALLRREPRVAWFRARDAANWALWLNGVILAGSLMMLAVLFRHLSPGALVGMAFVNGYGLLSMLQALLVRHAVAVHEDALFAPTAQPAAA
jgi:hypothetical protein